MRPNEDRIGSNDDFPEELDYLVRMLEGYDPCGLEVTDKEYDPNIQHLYYRMEARRCMARARYLLVNRKIDSHDLMVEEAILNYRIQFDHILSKFDRPIL